MEESKMMNNIVEQWNPINGMLKHDESGVYVWIDPETSVQYLICTDTNYRGMGIGITPRLNPDGSLRMKNPKDYNLKPQAKNLSEIAHCDELICSNCGIKLRNFTEVIYDEHANDTSYYAFNCRFCPNCGAKIDNSEER